MLIVNIRIYLIQIYHMLTVNEYMLTVNIRKFAPVRTCVYKLKFLTYQIHPSVSLSQADVLLKKNSKIY